MKPSPRAQPDTEAALVEFVELLMAALDIPEVADAARERLGVPRAPVIRAPIVPARGASRRRTR